MTSEELLQALNHVIDDETAMALYEEFAQEFDECNPCHLVVDNIRKTIQLFKAGQPYQMPDKFYQQFRMILTQKWKEKFPNAVIDS
ncbi:MAG: hypothetical protein N2112_03245 [Gemmataceae bacterium]|jgi:hypothetical protein|nr:hypothetical protein [Gemmataceae bacterium]